MQRLGVGKNVDEHLEILRAANKGNSQYLQAVDIWAKEIKTASGGFFDPLRNNPEMQAEFGKLAEAQRLVQGKVFPSAHAYGSLDEVQQAKTGLAASLEGQANLAGEGFPSVGKGSGGESGAMLTAWNKMKAGAKGTTHILEESWRMAKQSQHFGTARGAAIATLGLMAAKDIFTSPTEMNSPEYTGRQRTLMQSPDVGLAGMSGAPMPGSGGGHAVRGGEWRSPRRVDRPNPPQNTIPKRYYVNQTNRVPRVRYNASGDPYDQNAYASEVSSHIQRMAGGDSRINMVHDATSRRMNEVEFQDKMRHDLRGGR